MVRVRIPSGWAFIVAFAVIAITLFATVWTTRTTILSAADAARHGEALTLETSVRSELANLSPTVTRADLATMLREHAARGLRYIAVVFDDKTVVEAGTAADPDATETGVARRHRDDARNRLRVSRPIPGRRGETFVIELEPNQANALLDAATFELWIGAVAALVLLGVTAFLIRREAHRKATEREQERGRRLATLGEMSAVIAHELRNPLASLKGNAQLLASMQPDDRSRAKADRVVGEAVRLEHLVEDLLKFVRTGTLERELVDPSALLRAAATTLPSPVDIDTADAPARWSLDGGKFREVMINLLDNAIAAGPPVRAAIRLEAKRLVVEIVDHGPGVPAGDRDKIFEPFFTGKATGTGLGLAIVRRVVELHRGTIVVRDAPGGGALFRVEIPTG